jgi:hypothetical protein
MEHQRRDYELKYILDNLDIRSIEIGIQEYLAKFSTKRDIIRCKHGRSKYCCRDCGTGLCAHKKWRHQCNICKKGYCQHEKRRNSCKICRLIKVNLNPKPTPPQNPSQKTEIVKLEAYSPFI